MSFSRVQPPKKFSFIVSFVWVLCRFLMILTCNLTVTLTVVYTLSMFIVRLKTLGFIMRLTKECRLLNHFFCFVGMRLIFKYNAPDVVCLIPTRLLLSSLKMFNSNSACSLQTFYCTFLMSLIVMPGLQMYLTWHISDLTKAFLESFFLKESFFFNKIALFGSCFIIVF